MSNPLHELREILAGRSSLTGRIVSLGNGIVQVATAKGVIEVPHEQAMRVGDQVTVRDGRAVKTQDAENVPVYFV